MRRQGWALSLGMLVSGTVLGQPPATEERFPPAPELPGGVLVSKPLGTKEKEAKTITVTPFAVQRASLEVPSTPPPTPAPTTTVVTPSVTVPAPITTVTLPTPTTCGPTGCPEPCAPVCATGTCASKGPSHLPEWLQFRSTAKQSGHVPHPYYPPLYAWFPPGCVTNKPGPRGTGHCATGSCAPTPCATGNCTTTYAPAMAPTLTHVPGLSAAPLPNGFTTPTLGPSPTPAMLPTPVFTPPLPPAPPTTTFATPMESDPLAGFKKINDGLSFTPGGSPMAAPVKPVARPK